MSLLAILCTCVYMTKLEDCSHLSVWQNVTVARLTMNSAIIGTTFCTSADTRTSLEKIAGTKDLDAKAARPTATPTAAPICRIRRSTALASCRFSCRTLQQVNQDHLC